MAWTSSTASRNFQLDGASAELRAIQFLIKVKEVLAAAGWTVIGYGDGVDDSDFNTGGVTPTFPAFPSTTGMDDGAWLAVKSTSGAHVVMQVVGTGGQVHMWFSGASGYTDDGVGHSTRVGATTPPADEIGFSGTNTYFGNNTGTCYESILYTDDAESFVVIGLYSAKDFARGIFLKLTGYKTGDTRPFVASWYAEAATDTWDNADLCDPASDEVLGWHPGGNQKEYSFSNVLFDSIDFMSVAPVDPVSGDYPLMDCMVGSQIPGSEHVRGVAGGIMRAPGSRATGDKYDTNRWMGIGDFAIDGWNSASELSS